MFSYRALLKQAWRLTWKNKFLWFFGIFATIVASNGSSEYQLITSHLNQSLLDGSFTILGEFMAFEEMLVKLWLGLKLMFNQDFWVTINAITILITALTFLVVFTWLAISSQVALIENFKRLLSRKKEKLLSIRESLTIGHYKFWPVFGLNILIKVLVYILFVILSIPLLFVFFTNTNIVLVVYTIFFVVFIPLAVSLSLMVKYAIAYNVLYHTSFVVSLEKGWKLFKKNWLISLETAIILFIINFLAGVAVLLVLSIFLFPLFFFALILNLNWLIALIIFLAIVVVVLAGSILTTFQIGVWTDLFLQLHQGKGLAKLERVFRKK